MLVVDDEPDPGQLAFRRMWCEIQRGRGDPGEVREGSWSVPILPGSG